MTMTTDRRVPIRITWSWPQWGIDHAVWEEAPGSDPKDWSGTLCQPDPNASLLFEREHPHLARYVWAEGNFSCDCNRKIVFAGHTDRKCGNEIVIHRLEAIGVEVAALVEDPGFGLIHEGAI